MQKLEHTAPFVMGNETLQKLVNKSPADCWGMGVIFMTALAHEWDKEKHYWIARKNNGAYVTITCKLDYSCMGWGTIRRDLDGKMHVCQVIPKEIEAKLRKQTFEKLKFEMAQEKEKMLSRVLLNYDKK